jgi:acetolactate synthase-1/3 small subunit
MKELHPISLLVRNEPGVLARVAGLFARRGYNITSLAVGRTEDRDVSRISVVVRGEPPVIRQVVKQLRRLVAVIEVSDLSDSPKVERGLALIKVAAPPDKRAEILQLVNIFRARTDHVDNESIIIEIAGNREKVEAMIDILRPYGILEMARTGQIILSRKEILYREEAEGKSSEEWNADGNAAVFI